MEIYCPDCGKLFNSEKEMLEHYDKIHVAGSSEHESQGSMVMENSPTNETAKNKKKRFTFKFCPNCGSTDVYWAKGFPQLWSLWECRNCGYYGPVILEDGNMAAKLQEVWKNKTKK